MTNEVSAARDEREIGQVVSLLQVITGLLAVIAIILLLILARGPEDQQRSGVPPVVAAITASA